MQDKLQLVEEHYRSLFGLPSVGKLAIGLFIVSLSYGALMGVISGRLLDGIITGLLTLLQSGLLSGLILKLVLNEQHFTLKRTLGMSFVGSLLAGLGLIVAATFLLVIHNSRTFTYSMLLSSAALTAYTYTILKAMAIKGKAEVAAPLQSTLLAIGWIFCIEEIWAIEVDLNNLALAYLIGLATSIFSAQLYLSIINSVGKRKVGVKTLDLFKAFLATFYLDDAKLMEDLLEKLSSEATVEVKMLKLINANNLEALILSPEVHAGPFRRVGSSALPTEAIKEFMKDKILCVFLHPPVSHERDLPTSREVSKVLNQVRREYCELQPRLAKATKPVQLTRNGATVTSQIINGTALVIVTRSPHSTEDLPSEVKDSVYKRLKKVGVSDVVVVDAHNCIEGKVERLSYHDIEDIANLAEEAVRQALKAGFKVLKVGFAWESLEPYTQEEGAGEGGVAAVAMQVEGDVAAYVVFDGNNMVGGARERIMEDLKREGADIVEIMTTDVHTTSALKPGEGYYPLGRAVPVDLLRIKAVRAFKEAKKTLGDAKLAYKSFNIKVNTLKDSVWRLAETVDDAVRVARRGLTIIITTILSVSYILYVFL